MARLHKGSQCVSPFIGEFRRQALRKVCRLGRFCRLPVQFLSGRCRMVIVRLSFQNLHGYCHTSEAILPCCRAIDAGPVMASRTSKGGIMQSDSERGARRAGGDCTATTCPARFTLVELLVVIARSSACSSRCSCRRCNRLAKRCAARNVRTT